MVKIDMLFFGLFLSFEFMTIKIDIYLNLADAMMVVHGLPGDIAMAFFLQFLPGGELMKKKFFAPLRKQISNLKLRFSLGALGNQQVGYYDYLQTISSGGTISYAFGDKIKRQVLVSLLRMLLISLGKRLLQKISVWISDY